jgi:hypothetical protein
LSRQYCSDKTPVANTVGENFSHQSRSDKTQSPTLYNVIIQTSLANEGKKPLSSRKHNYFVSKAITVTNYLHVSRHTNTLQASVRALWQRHWPLRS